MSDGAATYRIRGPIALASASLAALVGISGSGAVSSQLGSNSFPFIQITLGLVTLAAVIVVCRRLIRWGKAIEQGSCEIETRLQALSNHSIVSILDADARLIQANARFLDTFGYEKQELLGSLATKVHADSPETSFKTILSHLRRGESWEGELLSRTKQEREVWTHSSIYPNVCQDGALVSSIWIHTDITDIKQAQAERDLRETLHLLHDEVYVFDAQTQNFVYLNQAAMDRFGWDEAVYTTKSVSEALPDYDARVFSGRTRALIDGEKKQITHRVDLFGRPHEIKLQYISGADGRGQFIAICRDVTAQKEFEQKKDAFVSTVSHELRSPLTSVTGGLDLVLSGVAGELPPKSRALVEIAQRNARRLILIINDILDLEKISAGQMEFNFKLTDISGLIKEAADANSAYCEKFGATLRLTGTDDPVLAKCDADRMFQVLNNLMSNAAKFSDPGGVVDVTLSQSAHRTTISVRDTGAGIPAEAIPTIFERFTQVSGHDRKAKGGTGLGLNIVKAIIKRHAGTVSCESTLGEGTCFTVCIPTQSAAFERPDSAHHLEAAE